MVHVTNMSPPQQVLYNLLQRSFDLGKQNEMQSDRIIRFNGVEIQKHRRCVVTNIIIIISSEYVIIEAFYTYMYVHICVCVCDFVEQVHAWLKKNNKTFVKRRGVRHRLGVSFVRPNLLFREAVVYFHQMFA